ncbi:endolytic transglycosylase MltG [Streptomyces sp. ST2-7A]|uniref:endolytic transglycosylase MltG n=1 Tax=Streptomyces sp. ST2-7A TaxID=2907214 RepID=UPI001F1FBF79|nr:endolytic transglycosylase MltG [Streptomyces sp. ST2-7A]MCE7079707.1 endolytic transglycosylase MltG [Streptomyces sp. ST2-7A]
MTEYGRGSGSEPWHPADPLYGDVPRGGDPGAAPDGRAPAGHGHPPDGQQQWSGDPDGGYGYPQQGQGQDGGWYGEAQSAAPQSPQHGGGDGWYDPNGGYGYPQQGQGQDGGWYGEAQSAAPQSPQHGGGDGWYDPNGGYGYPQQGQGQDGGWYGEARSAAPQGPDSWGGAPGAGNPPAQDGYPPSGAPGGRAEGNARGTANPPGADPETGWDPGPDQGEHDFFTSGFGHDEAPASRRTVRRRGGREQADPLDDRDVPGGSRGSRRSDGLDDPEAAEAPGPGDFDDRDDPRKRTGRGGRPKRRAGCGCLAALVLVTGGLGIAVHQGYQFYNSRFAAPEDFAGEGTESVQVEIPPGSSIAQMGNILKDAGVVKSVGAFISAAGESNIQAGVYSLRLEMSAASAVNALTDPSALNVLTIPEGMRAEQIYQAIDERLGVPEGTTREAAALGDFDLPEWADSHPDIKDPLEGFLFPARYDVAEGMDPEDVLARMVERAVTVYEGYGIEDAAAGLGLESPLQVLSVASLVQAEGITYDDFQQMAEVVYNRLEPDNDVTNRKLEFDSTYNYLMGQSEIRITEREIHSNRDPYNTYVHTGLPPGPIGNPGEVAIEASLDPTDEGWMFFISIDGEKTTFTRTLDEHEELRKEFNERQGIG